MFMAEYTLELPPVAECGYLMEETLLSNNNPEQPLLCLVEVDAEEEPDDREDTADLTREVESLGFLKYLILES
jgi:hypothetical protein